MQRKNATPVQTGEPRRTFWLELRSEHGIDPTEALRSGLKRLLRDHGLRCTRVSWSGGSVVPGFQGDDHKVAQFEDIFEDYRQAQEDRYLDGGAS